MRRRRRLQHPGRESRHRRVAAEALLRLLARSDRKGALKLVRLWREWDEVVGPEVAELARPLAARDGALVLWTGDAVAAQQLSFFTFEILSRANAFLGEEVFDKVRFELLDGRVPLGGMTREEPRTAPEPPPRPAQLGGLVDKIDPESAVGRAYMAYVRSFSESVSTVRPAGARRRKT